MLLIACAKVANLLLARYPARRHEFSVRAAMGASRAQVLRQLSAENLVLSGMGALGGVLSAAWSLRPMLALVPAAAGLLLVSMAASAIPAFRAMRIDPVRALRNA